MEIITQYNRGETKYGKFERQMHPSYKSMNLDRLVWFNYCPAWEHRMVGKVKDEG